MQSGNDTRDSPDVDEDGPAFASSETSDNPDGEKSEESTMSVKEKNQGMTVKQPRIIDGIRPLD